MRRPPWFALAIVTWLLLEFIAFAAVVGSVGLGGALLLGLATSIAGVAMLRKAGGDAFAQLRAAFVGAPQQPPDMLHGLIGAFAAMLLILPGFVSDLVGLALAAPSARQFLARRFGGTQAFTSGGSRKNPDILDLSPDEWFSLDQPEKARRR